MTAKSVMDVHPGRYFYVSTANFSRVDVTVPKYQKDGDIASAQQKYFIFKKTVFVPTGANETKSDSPVSVAHYKPTPDRSEKMAKRNAIEEKGDTILKNDWREDVQLQAKLEKNQLGLLEMLEEFESRGDGPLERINIAKHRIILLNGDVRPVHSAPYWPGQTARKFAAAEIGQLPQEKVIEPGTTE